MNDDAPTAIDPSKPWLNLTVTMANADARKRQERRTRDKIIMHRSRLLYPYKGRPFASGYYA